MFNVLLIEPEEDTREIISIALQTSFRVDVFEAVSLLEGTSILASSDKNFTCVFLSSEVDSEVAGWVEINKNLIPVVCMGYPERIASVKQLGQPVLQKPFLVRDLLDVFKTVIQGQVEKRVELLSYIQMKPQVLTDLETIPVDIQLKLSDDKYVRIFKAGEIFNQSDLEKLERKGVSVLFVKQSDSGTLVSALEKRLKDAEDVTSKVQKHIFERSNKSQQVLRDLSQTFGWSPEVKQLAETQVVSTIRAVAKSPKLSEMIEKFMEKPEGYLASHSTLCSFISCGIAKRLQWGSDVVAKTLVSASIFHDLVLSDDLINARRMIEEFIISKKSLDREEVIQYKAHPEQGAQFVSELSGVPSQVATILREHHEKPDGSGFPAGLPSTKISPISALFIVVEDFVDFLFDSNLTGNKKDVKHFLESRQSVYAAGTFREVLQALSEQLEEKS